MTEAEYQSEIEHTKDILPLQLSYRVTLVKILEKIDHVIMALHCIPIAMVVSLPQIHAISVMGYSTTFSTLTILSQLWWISWLDLLSWSEHLACCEPLIITEEVQFSSYFVVRRVHGKHPYDIWMCIMNSHHAVYLYAVFNDWCLHIQVSGTVHHIC